MINVAIKTEAQAKRVSSEMVNDLQSVLDIYNEYQVEKDKTNNEVTIKSDTSCPIITSAAVTAVLNVVNWYMFKYSSISYWIGWCKGTYQEFIPVIKIQFNISK